MTAARHPKLGVAPGTLSGETFNPESDGVQDSYSPLTSQDPHCHMGLVLISALESFLLVGVFIKVAK